MTTVQMNQADLEMAGKIDHTLLKPDATAAKVITLCDEAKTYHFASVCVNPTHVALCAKQLKGSEVKVCTVIGFPLGATTTATKVFEAQNAIDNGAQEVDMVINIGALKGGDTATVLEDIRAVAQTAHKNKALLKVIIETSLLSDDEKVTACKLAKEAGADFVKTSTGFSGGGATVADVALMRKTVGPEMGVKASGGVHNRAEADALVAAGATRIGASAGVAIVGGGDPPAASKGY